MLKNLLTCLLCLGTYSCFAQDSSIQIPTVDSSFNIITDFSSATKDNAKVLLSWHILLLSAIDFFTIERSCNGKDFEVITVLKQSSAEPINEWMDEAPAKGKNLYRVRCTTKDGQLFFSKTISSQVAGDISFKFYPNPVDNILIVRTELPIDIQIIDAAGKPRIQLTQVEGLQLINVSTLEKGIYLLRIQNKQSNLVKQEKLLKN